KLLSYLSSESLKAGQISFTIPFDRQELADYLFIDRSALSNEISKLQKEGILTCKKNKFTLLVTE
ncbi:MAG: helix-turn-helix domain-containing protein, partial [Brevinema sp.]